MKCFACSWRCSHKPSHLGTMQWHGWHGAGTAAHLVVVNRIMSAKLVTEACELRTRREGPWTFSELGACRGHVYEVCWCLCRCTICSVRVRQCVLIMFCIAITHTSHIVIILLVSWHRCLFTVYGITVSIVVPNRCRNIKVLSLTECTSSLLAEGHIKCLHFQMTLHVFFLLLLPPNSHKQCIL